MLIRCLKPPVQNLVENVNLSERGETAEIADLTHFWQGMVDHNKVEVVKPKSEAVNADAPETGQRFKVGKNVITVAEITDKAVICLKDDGKKFPVPIDKWKGTKAE